MSPSYPLIPGPPFLIDHLLGLLFVVHVVFMNFVIAAPPLMVWYLWTRQQDGKQFADWLAAALPVNFSFAINFGVASLLFTQVLFAERFFTANIILGKVWLAVILLLLLGFYAAYAANRILRKFNRPELAAGGVAVLVTGLVWTIAAIMIANYYLETDSAHWHELLGHWQGILRTKTFTPRAMHFLTGAFAVTGFWMVWISWWRERRGVAEELYKPFRQQGIFLAAGATGVQISVGIWFLIWQPIEVWDKLFSGSFPATIWITGVTTGLLMLGSLIVAAVFPDRKFWQKVSTALLGWTLFGMAAGRELVRQTAFGPDFHLQRLPYSTQVQPMFFFFLLLLAGMGVLLWILLLILGKAKTPK
ncbi:MAG TPA: hypothetical protein VGL38_02250 [bacterium]|jgi:hypothetical protein